MKVGDLDMLPRLALYDVLNTGFIYAIQFCEPILRNRTLCMKTSYFQNLGFSQFGFVVALPSRHSPLMYGILGVIAGRTKEQVSRVNTRWIIADMTNKEPVRDRAMVKFPSVSMGRGERCGSTSFILAIARTALTAYPEPTGISLFDVTPKSFSTRNDCRVMTSTKAKRLTFYPASFLTCLRCKVSRLPATTLAKVWTIKGQLDGGIRRWYTSHVGDLLTRLLTDPRPVDAGAGAFHA